MAKDFQDLERMMKGMMETASKMVVPATEFAKAARIVGRHLGLIPVDNSLRGRLRRKWRSFRERWELPVVGVLYVIFLTLTILGAIYFAYALGQCLEG